MLIDFDTMNDKFKYIIRNTMGKFIRNNKLVLDYDHEQIKHIFTSIMKYIYWYICLDLDKMKELYSDIDDPKDFDSIYVYKITVESELDKNYLDYFVDEDEDIDKDMYVHLMCEIHKYLKNNSAKDLKIKGVCNIKFINDAGINDDFRGVEDVDWKLFFHKKYVVKKKDITFEDLIIAAYKIKSHKFEDNYEMFCEITDLKCKETDNGKIIKMHADFDHGS